MTDHIAYRQHGHGDTILLIHGFPMNSHIWEAVAKRLSVSFRVILVDLPGFGDSAILPGNFTLADVADSVIHLLTKLNVNKVIPVGHSLGGYVTLAMVAERPELFPGFCLFHSTAMADTEEKKIARTKTISFIQTHGAENFSKNFIAPLFANDTHKDVPFVREMNLKSTSDALIGYTRAMRDRPDRMSVLKAFGKPVLFIAGAKDPAIPVDSIKEQASQTPLAEIHVLENQSHMALIEAPEVTADIVYDFAKRCYVNSRA